MSNEYGHGRGYQVDYDRGVIIEDRKGELIHSYLDEPGVWRDQQGRIVEQPSNTN